METTPDKKATKSTLMQAGLHLMAANGYHRTKVSDIVRESGVTQGSFYWYFPSKLEMALALIEQGRDQMLQALQQGYRTEYVTVDEMFKNSERLTLDLLKFAESNREFMLFLLVRGHGADPEVDKAIENARQALYEGMLRNINRATKLGMLPPSRVTPQRAAMTHSLIEGSIAWWLFGFGHDLNHVPEVSATAFAKRLVRFEFLGLLDGTSN